MSWTSLNNNDVIALFLKCNTCKDFDVCFKVNENINPDCSKIIDQDKIVERYKIIESVISKNNIKSLLKSICDDKDFVQKHQVKKICGSYSSKEIMVSTSDFTSENMTSFDKKAYDYCKKSDCSNIMAILTSENEMDNYCNNSYATIDYTIEF